MGMGLETLTISSDIQHIRMLCCHLRENGPITKSILATIRIHQLQYGLTTPILNCDKKYSIWLENGWIKTCWQALRRFDITLQCDLFISPPPSTE
jgi:hypothetical protein